jgi:glycosyltransferase involved in cell wall biosynthesis
VLSITILTKNSQKHLAAVLEALQGFDDVVIADTGSTDHTLKIAQQFPNVTVHSLPFEGFGPTHNAASALAKHDWIFSIDSDEILSPELQHELLNLTNLQNNQVYSVSRKNMYKGRHIKGCGWDPDRVIRLYNRNKTSFSHDLVHERVLSNDCTIIELAHPLIHLPFDKISDFLRKTEIYSDLYAQQRPTAKASLFKAVGHALFAFIKSYFFQRGWLLGAEGFEISWYNMNCAFYKYAKVRENDSIQ